MAKIERILDGAVALYQREKMGTLTWTARYKIKGAKGYVVHATGKRDLEEAKEVAREKFYELTADFRRGQAIHSHTFQRAVDAYLDDLDANIASGKTTARTKRDNMAVIDRYLLPYFRGKAIDAIRQEQIETYKTWRLNYWTAGPGAADATREYMRDGKLIKSKRPKKTQTQRSGEILVLKAIFNSARKRHWVKREQIPDIEEDKRGDNRRPAFTEAEWKRVTAAMAGYIHGANGPVVQHDRQMVCAYMRFMFETGLRPGKEHQQLTWADCELVERKADVGVARQTHVHVRDDTKTGKRTAVMCGTAWNDKDRMFLILDEADTMSTEAKTVLRGALEKNSERLMVILTSNDVSKFDHGLFDRCDDFDFTHGSVTTYLPLAERVLRAENVTVPDEVVVELVKRHSSSIRQLLRALEQVVLGIRKKQMQIAA